MDAKELQRDKVYTKKKDNNQYAYSIFSSYDILTKITCCIWEA